MLPYKTSTVTSQVEFDKTKKHRYFLKKVWNEDGKIATVIMLNPTKKADAILFDKSVMLMNNYFAKQMNNEDQPIYGGFIVVNLFSYRSNSNQEMLDNTKYKERFDEKTDEWISKAVNQSKDVYIAWGSNKDRKRRVTAVKKILKSYANKKVYKLNKNVHPSKYSGDFIFEEIAVREIDK